MQKGVSTVTPKRDVGCKSITYLVHNYSGASDKGPSEIGNGLSTKDTCCGTMLIL